MSTGVAAQKYSPPCLAKRSREQVTLLLVGYAWIGDPAARDLLKLLFPMPGEVPEQENSAAGSY